MKYNIRALCPRCGLTMQHRSVVLAEHLNLTCWPEEGGCGHEFTLVPVVMKAQYLDEFGYRTQYFAPMEEA